MKPDRRRGRTLSDLPRGHTAQAPPPAGRRRRNRHRLAALRFSSTVAAPRRKSRASKLVERCGIRMRLFRRRQPPQTAFTRNPIGPWISSWPLTTTALPGAARNCIGNYYHYRRHGMSSTRAFLICEDRTVCGPNGRAKWLSCLECSSGDLEGKKSKNRLSLVI